MEELKKCPFCGGKAVYITISNKSTHHSVGFEFKVECEDCGMELPGKYNVEFRLSECGEINILNDQRTGAISTWNRRAMDS